jgi:hypothetical protein
MRRYGARESINQFGVSWLLLALLALPACGEDRPNEAGSIDDAEDEQAFGENPYLQSEDLCSLVTVEQVAAAAGGIEPLRSEKGTFGPASCRYFFDVPDPYGPRQGSATLQMLSDFGLERIGAASAAIDVAGLGGDAWAREHTDTYLLYVRDEALVFSVNVAGGSDANWPEAARKIAELVLAEL